MLNVICMYMYIHLILCVASDAAHLLVDKFSESEFPLYARESVLQLMRNKSVMFIQMKRYYIETIFITKFCDEKGFTRNGNCGKPIISLFKLKYIVNFNNLKINSLVEETITRMKQLCYFYNN